VVFGCVSQVGSQSSNIARYAVLASKLPETVPGTTVDRQCGSSLQALHFAAQAVMSGVQDVVIAGGVEVMSTVPIGSNVADGYSAGRGLPWAGQGIKQRYGKVMFSQFQGAELVAQKVGLTRVELDAFGAERWVGWASPWAVGGGWGSK
jgi:acetyl-CoA C-acetyltransferase